MTQRNMRPWILTIIIALSGLLALSGCHLIVGPDEGSQDWWYYCDESGCYECTRDGCAIPGSHCFSDNDCPVPMYCDTGTHTCRSNPTCSVTAECSPGNICSGGKCVPGRVPCTDHESCGDGAYCSNGTCKDSRLCEGDGDCVALGSFVCSDSGTCVPGTPKKTCQSAGNCDQGLCMDGECGTCSGDCGGGVTCHFNKHCGTGRVCLDGQCVNSCTEQKDCASGQVCKSQVCVAQVGTCVANTDCGSGEVCVNNTCLQNCTTSGTCSSASDVCSAAISTGNTSVKVCVADHSAKPECKVTNNCTGGEVCVNGVCRTSCVTSPDCAVCEDGPVCGQGGFCMSATEADPQCKTSTDCTGKVCLDAQCVSLY